MQESQDELFKREDFFRKEYKADHVFSKSYQEMTGEVKRVANERVMIWSRLAMWLYEKIHGDKTLLRAKQNNKQKHQSARGFKKVAKIFQPYDDNSMSNEEIFKTAKEKFTKK